MKINQFISILVLLIPVLFVSCKKKYPVISYLRPQQKYSNGFLDQHNYQWVETGYIFATSKIQNLSSEFVPYPYPVGFQESGLEQAKKPGQKYYSLDEIAETDLLAIEDEGVDLSALDLQIVEINSLKRNIMDAACQNAQARTLFYFMEFLSRDNIYMEKKPNPLAAVNAKYLPVPDVYTTEHLDIIRNYSSALQAAGFKYEILREEIANPRSFDCRMSILFKKKNLVLLAPTLQDR